MILHVEDLIGEISKHPNYSYAVAFGMIRGVMQTCDSPSQKVRNIQNILTAFERVTAVR